MKVFLSTADASGDLHGAGLVRALRTQLAERGESLDLFGLGGEELCGLGLEPTVPSEQMAVAGLVEILSSAARVIGGYRALRAAVMERKPDVAVLVDSPDLNLPLAAVARRAGVPVVYYVAPQVWAWRSGRVRTLRRRANRVGVIFPFEQPLLEAGGVAATFVGHPLVDHVEARRPTIDGVALLRDLELDADRPVLGLLPGSRRNEIARNLPLMVEVAELLCAQLPELQVALIAAPALRPEIERAKLPKLVRVVSGRSIDAMSVSTVLLAAPGTATLEAALLGVPIVVCHRVNRLSYEIARRVTHVSATCMVNLIAEEGVVPEYIQDAARPPAIAGRIASLLADHQLRDELAGKVRRAATRLGGPGASARMAQVVLEVVSKS